MDDPYIRKGKEGEIDKSLHNLTVERGGGEWFLKHEYYLKFCKTFSDNSFQSYSTQQCSFKGVGVV